MTIDVRDVSQEFIDIVNEHTTNQEAKEAFVGFAIDARTDELKMTALNAYLDKYRKPDGSYDPDLFDNEVYELIDFYNDWLAINKFG